MRYGLLILTVILLFGFPFNALGRENSSPDLNEQIVTQVEILALRHKAQDEGSVRVIVQLDLSFSPEGVLHSHLAVQQQRSNIQRTQQRLIQRLGLGSDRVIRRFKYVPQLIMEVNLFQLDALINDPSVLSLHEDKLVGLNLSSSVPHIGGNNAWAEGFKGAGQVVAVLDSGVDSDHEFLTGKVVSAACYSNAGGSGDGTSLCPDGSSVQIGAAAGENCDGIIGCDHGTHVAGIAVGKGATFSGVAPDADLIAIQVFTEFVDPLCSDLDVPNSPCILTYMYTDLIAGLERVYELRDTFNIAAVNLSLGGGKYTSPCSGSPIEASINNLRSAGIATIVASGNSEYRDGIGEPACIPSAISVASVNLDDDVSWFSSVASFLDFFAPGQVIESSLPGDVYGYMQGTSMAAPHVAGAWAVIKSKVPQANVDFVYDVLVKTGIPVSDERIGGSVTDIPRIQLDDGINKIQIQLCPMVRNQTAP